MFCSTIIPTIGRPSLDRAVNSVLTQDFAADDYEIIVVNDSGRPLPPADWQQSPNVHLLHTQRRERCVARNTGAAIARGDYLHFLDDDDWLLPGAYAALWKLATRVQGAGLFVGGSQLMDRESIPLIQLQPQMSGNCFLPVMAGEWVPLQSSIIKSEVFFSVGGFNPAIPGIEDVDLSRRLALHHDFSVTGELVACIGMGPANSATDSQVARKYGRQVRELILEEPDAFHRMRAFATNAFWHGRIARIYLTSVVWNCGHRNLFKSKSRMIMALTEFVLAWRYLSSAQFWRAVVKPYESDTFAKGIQAAGKQNQ